jgi:hypothetical protein
MNKFRSSYGAAPAVSAANVTTATAQKLVDQTLTPPPSGGGSGEIGQYIDYFNKSSSGLNQILFGKDPRVAAAIKGAMVKNLEKSSAKYAKVPIIGDYLAGQYRTTKAEYKALYAQGKTADIQDSLSIATRAGGLLLGVSLFALVVSQISLSRARTRAVSQGY